MHPSAARVLKRSFTQMLVQNQARTGLKQSARGMLARPALSSFSTAVHHPSALEKDSSAATDEGATLVHFKQVSKLVDDALIWENPVPHPVYDLDAIAQVKQTHHESEKMHEKAALLAVKVMRGGFDLASRYRGPGGGMTARDWLNRCVFLESVAGVPGMVAGMARHLRSLRSMKRDYGWIHTLLEEAENERMHLLIFMNMKQPGWLFRLMVLGAQGVFFNMFFVTYLVSPRTCHRFVGYLEEEAVKTYTGLLKDIEDGHVEEWSNQQAPLIARNYYKLPEDAKVFDVITCIRADEVNHRDVNHTLASLDQEKGVNPFIHGH